MGVAHQSEPSSPERIAEFEEKVRSRHELTVLRRWHEKHRPAAQAELTRLGAMDLATMADAELLEHIHTLVIRARHAIAVHFTDGFASMLVIGRLGLFCQERLGLSDPETIGLLAGNSSASSEPTARMEALACEVAKDPTLTTVLQATDPWDDPRVRATLQPYLDAYGHRQIDFQLDSPTLAEQPRRAVKLLQEAVSRVMVGKFSVTQDAATVRPAETVLQERLSNDDERGEFDRLLREARAAYGVRDDDNSFAMWARGLLRYAVLEAGRRLAERGLIEEPDDVWFLRLAELHTCLTGAEYGGMRERAAERRIGHQRRAAEGHPPQTLGAPLPLSPQPPLSDEALEAVRARGWARSLAGASEQDAQAQTPGELRGVAGSAGVYTGRARVLLSESGFDQIEPGDVLVCSYSSPSWSIIFGSLGAVVADAGGLLSHAAITAREYGIPAVVGVKTATNLIPDGAIVTVDGTNGVVRIADASGAMVREAP
jgi:pyruvate,water dikinase